MIALPLGEIAEILRGELRLHAADTADTVVDGIVDTDSREMVPGAVFVAKPGETTDGHRFVPAAADAGAVLAIVGAFVIAAIVTPPDVVSQLALAIPMCLLYEGGIWAVRLFVRQRESDDEAAQPGESPERG